VKTGTSTMDLAEQLMADIARFRKEQGCDGGHGVVRQHRGLPHPSAVHQSLAGLEKDCGERTRRCAPSQVYA